MIISSGRKQVPPIFVNVFLKQRKSSARNILQKEVLANPMGATTVFMEDGMIPAVLKAILNQNKVCNAQTAPFIITEEMNPPGIHPRTDMEDGHKNL